MSPEVLIKISGFVSPAALRHKLITVAAHGEKMPRLLRVVFQLLPQPAHVNVNGAGQHSGFIAPNLAQQFITRKRSAAWGDKVAEQLKLARGEFDLLTVAKHLGAPKVYNDRAKAKRVERLGCARRGPAAPQQRFQPRQQLERLEWFAKIVIRAQLQAQDFVDYLASRRQHQNRRRDTALPQIAAHIKAVFARQHDVQNDHVEVAFAGARQTRQAIGGSLNAIVFRVEQVHEGHRDA